MEIQKVQAWLGRSTIKLTVDTYAHIQPRDHREEISRVYRPKTKHLRVVGGKDINCDDEGEE